MRPSTRLEFTSATEAEEVGLALAGSYAAVLVYGCRVIDGVEVAEDFEIFARHGEIDEVLAA